MSLRSRTMLGDLAGTQDRMSFAIGNLTARDTGFADWLLRFSPAVEALYEQERGAARGAYLRRTIFIGLVFYNLYISSDYIALRDVFTLSLILRFAVMLPATLTIAWAVKRVPAGLREWLVTAGMIGSVALPVVLFYLSRSPLAPLVFFEAPLTLVYGNLMLVLRFRHALLMTAVSMAMLLLALTFKPDLALTVRLMLGLQMATTCFFTLYGNYMTEYAGRSGFLAELREMIRSDALETQGAQLARLAVTDPLTGLANRRMLDEVLAGWAGAEVTSHQAVAIMMIDIDYFKRYNDHFGHQQGDVCLRAVAAALAGAMQPAGDFLARYGGEEFAVLVQGIDAAALEALAGRLRAAVAALALPHPQAPGGVVSVSIGGALAVAGSHAALPALLAAADAALYEAKEAGRNRHCLRLLHGAAA